MLCIGASGLLGKYLHRTVPDYLEFLGTYNSSPINGYEYCDVTVGASVDGLFDYVRPDYVIMCAGEGSVDKCEKKPFDTSLVNVVGTENVATACEVSQTPLIYVSTNAVYSGADRVITEDSDRRPLNEYGRQKVTSENSVKYYDMVSQIIRPQFVYGIPNEGRRKNWIYTITQGLSEGRRFELVSDVYWQPTYAPDVARAIWDQISVNFTAGVSLNVASEVSLSLYQMGVHIARLLNYNEDLITPVSISQFGDLAPRPFRTNYDLTRLKSTGLICQNFNYGVQKMIEDMNG